MLRSRLQCPIRNPDLPRHALVIDVAHRITFHAASWDGVFFWELGIELSELFPAHSLASGLGLGFVWEMRWRGVCGGRHNEDVNFDIDVVSGFNSWGAKLYIWRV